VNAEFISVSTIVILNLFQYLVFELLMSRSWNKFRMTEVGFIMMAFEWMLNLFQYLGFGLLRSRSWNKFRMTEVGFRMMAFEWILNLFQYPLSSCWIYFSIHSRHAEFISVSTIVIQNLFQYPLSSCWIYFSIHSRHAEFISVSGLWVVKVEILKQVQDEGSWVQNDGVWVDTEFISVSTIVILNLFQYLVFELLMSRSWNKFRMTEVGFRMMAFECMLYLFQYPLSSCWIYFSIWALSC
jgi:hypothetical protein